MKKFLTALLAVLPLLLLPLDSHADKGKGPSDRAYERASDNASFKRDGDKKKHKEKDKKKGDRDDHDRDDHDRDDHDRDDHDRDDHDRDEGKRKRDRMNEKKGRFD